MSDSVCIRKKKNDGKCCSCCGKFDAANVTIWRYYGFVEGKVLSHNFLIVYMKCECDYLNSSNTMAHQYYMLLLLCFQVHKQILFPVDESVSLRWAANIK